MSHPVEPEREGPEDVVVALLNELPPEDRARWYLRWQEARSVEMRRREYDRRWDESLMGVTRFGQ